MDAEMQAFASDVLESIRQAKSGQGRVHRVTLSAAAEARAKVGVSQSEFAQLLGVSVRTLQDWEQGRREPSGAARTLLRIAMSNPEAVRLAA
jgi:putative transcriptional regulator